MKLLILGLFLTSALAQANPGEWLTCTPSNAKANGASASIALNRGDAAYEVGFLVSLTTQNKKTVQLDGTVSGADFARMETASLYSAKVDSASRLHAGVLTINETNAMLAYGGVVYIFNCTKTDY